MRTVVAMLLAVALLWALGPAAASVQEQTQEKQEKKKEKKAKKEKKEKKTKEEGASDEAKPTPGDLQRQLERNLHDMQFALEGSSPRSFLGYIDSAKFDDYPRFEDMVERLLREDTIRAFFRTAFAAPPTTQGKAQMAVDADMELVRKDAAGQLQRRRQQLVIDWEYTKRGWKIINITPRDFFRPL